MEIKTHARCSKCGAITEYYHEEGEAPFLGECIAPTKFAVRPYVGETRCMNTITEADVLPKTGKNSYAGV